MPHFLDPQVYVYQKGINTFTNWSNTSQVRVVQCVKHYQTAWIIKQPSRAAPKLMPQLIKLITLNITVRITIEVKIRPRVRHSVIHRRKTSTHSQAQHYMELKGKLRIPIMPSTPSWERDGRPAYWLRTYGRLRISLTWARFKLAVPCNRLLLNTPYT